MGIEVEKYDGNILRLSAPLTPNINDKQTAFGGSLFCVCVLSCWGMVYLKTQEKAITCNQVVTDSNISYLKPVGGKIIAECKSPSNEELESFFSAYEAKGKSKISLQSKIVCDNKTAVNFSGQYAIISA